jgi:proline iminopeptidase
MNGKPVMAAACVLALTAGCRTPAPSVAAREGRIAVPGGRVWYRVVGADRPGVPLLVLHGGPGMPHDYLESLAALADERPVVFYDQLGCGQSDRPADPSLWTVAHFVNELTVVRRQLDLRRMHLFGHSWGTVLAVEYLLNQNPRGIVSLTLASPTLNTLRWEADQHELVRQLPEAMRSAIDRARTTGDFRDPEFQAAWEEFASRHLCRLDPPSAAYLRAWEKMGREVYVELWGPNPFIATGHLKDYDCVDQLERICVPTLFTCGRYDDATPASTTYYRSKVPGARLTVFEGASHLHPLEKADDYVRTLRRFLNEAETHGLESTQRR